MKRLLGLALFMGFAATAQDFYGVATYTSFTTFKDMNIKVEGDPAMEARMKEHMSKGLEREYTLAFNLTGGKPKEDRLVTAWYTPDIPVSHGPAEYWGLPGLILEVNDGSMILLCSKLMLNPEKKFEVKPPKKGERVTRAEFDAIKKKKQGERN